MVIAQQNVRYFFSCQIQIFIRQKGEIVHANDRSQFYR